MMNPISKSDQPNEIRRILLLALCGALFSLMLSHQVLAQTKPVPAVPPKTITPTKPAAKPPSVTKPPSNQAIPTLITPKNVGVVRLGMPIDSVKLLFPKDRVYRVFVYDGNGRYEEMQISAPDKTSRFLLINPTKGADSIWRVREIIAQNAYFKTNRAVKTGMTLDDLVLAYGYLDSRWEEENLIVRNREGIDFILNTSDIPKRWYRKMKLDHLPLNADIIGISVK